MKKLILSVAVLTFTVCNYAYANEPKPSEKKDGIFTQKLGSGSSVLFYTVDTHTRLCFVTPGGGAALTNIDCDQLKKREAWKSIINW